mgnify:CR=1 FL=1
MIDSYLLLTPILMLGVLALVRFIGCDVVFGLHRDAIPPTDVIAVGRSQSVDVSWHDGGGSSRFEVIYGTQAGGPYPDRLAVQASSGLEYSATVPGLVNSTVYYFRVKAFTSDDDAQSEEVSASPGVPFIAPTPAAAMLGAQRNNFQGWVGMAVQLGPAPVVVTQLGRMIAPGNTRTHVVKIVDAITTADLGAVTVDLGTPAAPVREFKYAILDPPVTLIANGRYFIVSHEETNGDLWFDLPTTVQTTAVAAVESGVYNDDNDAAGYLVQGGPGQTYVPVNFFY